MKGFSFKDSTANCHKMQSHKFYYKEKLTKNKQ